MERRVTTQDISWFLDLRRNGQLDLEPAYQRRSVWSPRDRRFFLDTIFNSYPSPAIFLQKRVMSDGRHVHEVVDGKQRLETILKFVDNRLAIDPDFPDPRLAGKRWKQIADPELKRRFWDYIVPVEFIRLEEVSSVNEVFERLNRNSRKLERQELRHARNDGWFVTYAEKEAEQPFWRLVGVSTTSRSKRMKDVQFVSELLMVVLHDHIQGFDQDDLDAVYAEYDVPTETDPEFDEAAFIERVEGAKRYIEWMLRDVPEVENYLGTLTNLYTLWGVLILERSRIPSHPKDSATNYVRFMKHVERLRELQSRGELPASMGEGDEQLAYRYFVNATGASTETAQREGRHAALAQVLGAPA